MAESLADRGRARPPSEACMDCICLTWLWVVALAAWAGWTARARVQSAIAGSQACCVQLRANFAVQQTQCAALQVGWAAGPRRIGAA